MWPTLFLVALLSPMIGPPDAVSAQRREAATRCPSVARPCITVSFRSAELQQVAAAFAEFSGYSIVVGSGVSGRVTAEIRDQPWDVALHAMLRAHGLAAREVYPFLLRIDAEERMREVEAREPLVTQVFRINYVPVQEIAATIGPLTSPRGTVATSPSTNTLIVTDTEASLSRIAALLGGSPR
jgi:type II secretory pathway component GspD/PulD (secretin)